MGCLFCSYYYSNKTTRFRNAIQNVSQADKIKPILEENKKRVNSQIDNEGNTPLLLSIEHRNLECFKQLVNEKDINLDKPNKYTQHRPLHLLALTKPINLKPQNSTCTSNDAFKYRKESFTFGNSSMLLVASSTNENSLHTGSIRNPSLASFKSDVSVKTKLKSIDSEILREMIKLLAKNGANLNAPSNITRSTSKSSNSFSSFPNVNLKCSDLFDKITEMTPLFTAILMSQNNIFIEELIRYGCDLNYQDKKTKISALHLACGITRPDLVKTILDNSKFSLNLKSSSGFNVLHYLALADKDDISVAQLIISHLKQNFINDSKLNTKHNLEDYLTEFIDQQNNHGQTALMLAAAKNKLNLVRFLLDYKSSIKLTDSKGYNAIHYSKHNSCADLLNSYLRFVEKLKEKDSFKTKENVESNTVYSSNDVKVTITDYSDSNDNLNISDIKINMDRLNVNC